jgi:NTE family protein
MFRYDQEREEGFRRIADRVAVYRARRGREGRSVGLALGAGAARGLAHIGALKTLIEAEVEVDLIAGCSIGAVIGGMVACGISCDELAQIASGINRLRMLSYTDLTLPVKGLLSGQRIQSFLSDHLGDRTIEEASIPFVAAATDILTGEEIVLDSGPMIDGIRASISVPGVFAPHTVSGRFLVDGGLVNPVPVDYLRLAGIDVCVAVNVVPRVDRKYIEQPSVIDVLLNAFDIMEHRVILSRNQPADIEICPTADQVSGIEFWRAKELMRLGEEAARDSIDRILEAIGG